MQVYLPRGRKNITPEFHVTGEKRIFPLNAELIADSWNNKLKIWNAIFKLDFKDVITGDIILKMEIPVSEEGDVLNKEMKLSLFR